MPLTQIIYISDPVETMSFLGLMRLLYHSFMNNQADEITGVLIFNDVRFGQVIEGPQDRIEALWTSIQQDSRHKNVQLIGTSVIPERNFSKWSMVFRGSHVLAEQLPEVGPAVEEIILPDDHPLMLALNRN
jgi:hypothetical protein